VNRWLLPGLCLACLVAPGFAPAQAGLRSRELPAPVEPVEPALAARAAEAGEGGRVHAIVRVPREGRRAATAGGVRLLHPLGSDLWLASLPAAAVLERALPAGARAAWALRAEDRHAPGFEAWRAERAAAGEACELRVKVFGDAGTGPVRAAVEAGGGEVRREAPAFGRLDVVVPAGLVTELLRLDGVRWIERSPGEGEDANNGLRADIEVDPVQAEGLLGNGVVFGAWESGVPDTSHPDLTGRITPAEAGMSLTNHATHVAGILLGDGTNSLSQGGGGWQWRGVAHGATLTSWTTTNAVTEVDSAIHSWGVDVANNSWVYAVTGSNCDLFGDYAADAPEYDAVVTGIYGQTIPVVFSAGNERDDGDCSIIANGGYWTIPPPATAKNVIAVGAHFSDVGYMTPFSSWGPTDDGRMKPDLSAPGCEQFGDFGVTSTFPGGTYGTLCGTSMSAPAVSASIGILVEVWRSIYAGDPRPATAKALLGGFAKDRANPGPDYRFGLGAIHVLASVNALRSATTIEDEVADLGTDEWTFRVPAGTDTLTVTLAWDDPAAAELADPTLVNDLDLELVDPSAGTHLPFVLDPANPSLDAVPGVNHLDNVEQVRVLAPAPGTWTARVLGSNVPQGPQKYSLVGFDTRPPADPAAAAATATNDTTVTLTWIRPGDVDRAGTLVVRSLAPIAWTPQAGTTYAPGAEPATGVRVVASDDADHSGTPLADAPLAPGTLYHYAFFAYDEIPNYSPGVTDTATTAADPTDVAVLPPAGSGAPRLRSVGANPVRGRAEFRLELPADTVVELAVYDLAGRRVATLLSGERTAGSHRVAWDGRRPDGGAAAGGIYFVRMRAGATEQTRKVVLVR